MSDNSSSTPPPPHPTQNLFKAILEWPGEVWAFMLLRIGLGVRFFTAGIEKFRGPQYRLNPEQMKGISDEMTPEQIKANTEVFPSKIEEFVHGELSEKYEGDNGLDPEAVKEAFGERFFDAYVQHYENPVIDFEKLPGGDPKLLLDPFIQEALTDRLANDNGGLDMAQVTTAFGKDFAQTEKFFEVDGGEKFFTDELLNVLVDTPKEKLGEVLGSDALGAFVQYIGDEFGRQVIQSGTQFNSTLVDLLANTSDSNQIAKTLGYDAHSLIVDAVKKSIANFGPDSINTSYVYNLRNYYSNQEKFLEVQETWYATFPIMPQWSLKPFVYGLGYVLVVAGLTTLLGIKTRLSLAVMAATYLALAFGAGGLASGPSTDPVQFNILLTMLFVHVFMTVYALKLSKHDKFSLLK